MGCNITVCSLLPQVIEISGLTKHWLTECEAKAKFKECPNCGEAVLGKQYDSHVTSCRRQSLESGLSLCPLCHSSIKEGEKVGIDSVLYSIHTYFFTCTVKVLIVAYAIE